MNWALSPAPSFKTLLEVQLHAELQDSRRICSLDYAKGARAQRRARIGDTSAGSVDGTSRVAEVGVVEAVEALSPGFELKRLMQRNEFAESRVHVRVMRTVELKRA